MIINALAILALTTVPALSARADQIDYLIKYNNQTQYDNDNAPGSHSTDGILQSNHAMIVKAWRPSQDTIDQDGNVVYNYLPGIWLLISVVNSDRDINLNSNLELSFNRTKCNIKASGCLKARNANAPPTQDVRYEPVYMGTNIPWGNIN